MFRFFKKTSPRQLIGKVLNYRLAILSLVAAAFASRVTSLSHETMPYLFCDEGMFFLDAFSMHTSRDYVTHEFRSGSLNSLPISYIATFLSGSATLTPDAFLALGRIILPIGLSSFATIFIYFSAKRLSNSYTGVLAALIYVLSPFEFAVSRYWYPDHYIAFFSALFIYVSLGSKIETLGARGILKLAFIAALGLSVKLTFGFLIIGWFVFETFRLNMRAKLDRPILVQAAKNAVLTFLSVALFFAAINYSIFLEPHLFLEGLAYNSANYGSGARSFSGVEFYSVIALVFISPILTLIGLSQLLSREIRFQLLNLGLPVIIFIVVMGFQGMVINRNLAVVSPHVVLITALGVGRLLTRLRTFKFWTTRVAAISLIAAGLAANAYSLTISIADNFKADSRLLAITSLERSELKRSNSVGVNWSCSGESPAIAAGINVAVDSSMDKKLDYYVFDTAYWSSISSQFWGTASVEYFVNQRYMHFYNLNDRQMLRNIFMFLFIRDSNDIPEIKGYSVHQIIQGEGPSIVVLRRDREN